MKRFLFAGFFLLFCLTSSGGLESGDAVTRWETAKSFAAGGDGAIDVPLSYNGSVQGRGGRTYACFGTLQPLLMLPWISLARVLPLPPEKRDAVARLGFNLVFLPALSALTLVLVFLALQTSGLSQFAAVSTVLCLGVATPFWHYARTAQEENLLAAAFACWLLGMARQERGRGGGWLLVALGGCLALATRWAAIASVVPLTVVSLWALVRARGRVRSREVIGALLLCALTLTALLLYNVHRFGSPFETGYHRLFAREGIPFFTPGEAPGRFLALLLSPYRGLLVYVPMIVIAWLGLVSLRRRGPLDLAGPAALAGALVLSSIYTLWSAGYAWGPRFLVGTLVLFAPGFAVYFERFGWRGARALFLLSVVIQIASVVVPASAEEIVRDRKGATQTSLTDAWKCDLTPVCLRGALVVRAIGNTLRAEPGIILPEGSDRTELALESSDYRTLFWWPFRFSFRFHLFPLWVAFLITGVGITAALVALAMGIKKARKPNGLPG